MSDALSSQNTYISIGDAESPESFIEIGEVKTLGGPNETADEMDVTHLRSAGGYKEFLQSFKDGGELPLTVNFLSGDTGQALLRTLFASGANRGYKITYPDAAFHTFVAWVKGIGSSAGVGTPLEGTFTLRIVGAVTLTP